MKFWMETMKRLRTSTNTAPAERRLCVAASLWLALTLWQMSELGKNDRTWDGRCLDATVKLHIWPPCGETRAGVCGEREKKRENARERERMGKEVVLSSRFNDFTIWLWCRPHLTEMKSTDIMELFLLQTQNEQLTSIKYINLTMYQLYFKWIFLWNHAERDILCLYSNHNMSCHICWMWKAEELCVAGDFSEEYALNIHSTCSLVYFNLVSQHSFWVTAFRAE